MFHPDRIFIYVLLISVVTTVIYLVYYFVNVYYLLKHGNAKKTKSYVETGDVTILIPVYNEKAGLFARVIDSAAAQGVNIIVVGDSSNEPYRSIAESKGAHFIYVERRGGKRRALSEGIKFVNTKFVLFLDSDTVLPKDAVKKMMAHFKEDVGGVGANVTVVRSSKGASYSAEFMERAREIVLRAMSAHGGSVMVIDGKCAMYRTDLIKPLVISKEFTEPKVAGRPAIMGDDQQMTSYIIRNGYKAEKSFEVMVETEPPENFKQFTKQSIRWARSSYYYFFKNIFNGTALHAGGFYTFETIATFVMPFLTLGLGLFRLYFEFRFIGYHAGTFFDVIRDFIAFNLIGFHGGRNSIIHLLSFAGIPGPAIFGSALAFNLKRERLRTLGYGGVALLIIFLTSIYGMLTCWKQWTWLTR
ncbi:MAG: glycosyltransferase family 2 protein [Thermoplasmatales archaeon]